MNHLKFICFLSCFFITLSSCSDNNLAQKADGCWQGEFNLKNEESLPYSLTTIYRFNYKENSEKDGGTFIQSNRALQQFQEDGIMVKATVLSEIKGNWEVLFGDLCLTYKLSSLEVRVTDVKYKISQKADMGTQFGIIEHELASTFTGGASMKELLAEEMRKEAYQSLYARYMNDNEEEKLYTGLEINEDTLSFETIDEGIVRFVRIDKELDDSQKH